MEFKKFVDFKRVQDVIKVVTNEGVISVSKNNINSVTVNNHYNTIYIALHYDNINDTLHHLYLDVKDNLQDGLYLFNLLNGFSIKNKINKLGKSYREEFKC